MLRRLARALLGQQIQQVILGSRILTACKPSAYTWTIGREVILYILCPNLALCPAWLQGLLCKGKAGREAVLQPDLPAAGLLSLQAWWQGLHHTRHSTTSAGLKVYKPTTPGKPFSDVNIDA